jgi:phosphomannomutase
VAQTGESLGARLRRLAARHGHSAWGRTAVPFDSKARAALAALRSQPPVEIAGSRAGPVDARDGLRIPLDAGFLMLRASGTERLIRIYAEAPAARTLASRLREGARLLGAASRSRPRAVAGRRVDDAGRGG